ncbi:unnamed protein product [Caenorhabditis auriculariae]|uniref:Uncharacterized protein n=1 Tax=Caenorhabditis auriculariae TaxID=2777116 RepID=A0A8S1HBI3_9PELO|nr:unnamed protein product [Caenorhabditis auriculariae]
MTTDYHTPVHLSCYPGSNYRRYLLVSTSRFTSERTIKPPPQRNLDSLFNFSGSFHFNQHQLAISGFFKNEVLQRVYVNDDMHSMK